MQKVYGNHVGLVVNTQDPENRGRVQVFVPHLSPTLYKDWNKNIKNISFKSLDDGVNGNSVFNDDVLNRLYAHLPWAEAVVPFWGGSTGFPINESFNQATPIPTDQNFSYIVPPDGVGGGGVFQNHNGDRRGDLGQTLAQTIAKGLQGTGLNWYSYSGTGSTAGQAAGSKHLTGQASDGYFVDAKTGQKLNPALNETDRGRVAYALFKLTQAGIGGIGYGPGYMGGTTNFHLDVGGAGRNWGRDFTQNTATDWVVRARSGIGLDASVVAAARNSQPPPEAYRDTRGVSVDGIAQTNGDMNGGTITLGNGFANAVINSINSSLNLGSRQLANNAAIAYATAYRESIARGATPQQASIVAAAIVGNIKQESGFNPNTIHDGGRGYGLLGEQGPHLTRLLNYAASKGENRNTGISVQTQIEALFRDPDFLNGRPSSSGFPAWRGLTTLFNAGSVQEAARLFSGQTLNPTTGWGYLRPGNPMLQNRINNAVAANQAFSSVGAGELVTAVEGQNVIRTRVPDQYGSIDGPRTGGTMGFNSIPYVGAKVWVFFMGGDIQRPVYFGAIYEPNNIV